MLRIAHVYGEYSSKYIATALTMARVYQHLEKEMEWLWTKDLRINTVHVDDTARALWQAAVWFEHGKKDWDAKAWGSTPIFNIVDHGNTCTYRLIVHLRNRLRLLATPAVIVAPLHDRCLIEYIFPTAQGTLATLIAQVFNIQTGFQGQIASSFARLNLDWTVDYINDETLGPWAELLAQANITRPGPLSPFMEKELLKDMDLSLDGSRFEQVTGFRYEKEQLTKEGIEAMIESYRRMGWWP